MKRTLWVASSIAVLALPVGAVAARGIAGSRTSDLGSLQQAISSKSVVDLAMSNKPVCRLDVKTYTHCATIYGGPICSCH